MAGDDGEEALEALPPALDDLVREAVREDLAGEGRDVHARGLALEDVAEGLEVGVAAAHDRVAELERGDVRLAWVGSKCRRWQWLENEQGGTEGEGR